MDWLSIIQQIVEIAVIPALGILLSWLTTKIVEKLETDKKQKEAELAAAYLKELDALIINCVKATNQTFVDELKKQGSFDKAAQAQALDKTLDAIFGLLSEEAETHLTRLVGDLRKYIEEKVEASIEEVKK